MTRELVPQSAIDQAFSAPFNPPLVHRESDEKAFAEEYWTAHEAVAKCLIKFGEENDYGDGDFVMNQDYGPSRNIAIELSSRRLWAQEVVDGVAGCLSELGQRYRVFITHSLLNEPDFYILVERGGAKGSFDSESIAWQFGFE